MIVLQNYKGDEIELKYREAGTGPLTTIALSLDELYAGADTTEKFLLMLYDEGRVPYSQRVKRAAFVNFIKGALENFAFIGNFDSYIFILREIFGQGSDFIFDIDDPGKLAISVNAMADLLFDMIGRELVDGSYTYFDVVDMDGNTIVFKGLSGIETEYELNLLFSEIMPAGLVPTVSLDYFLKSTFYGEDTDGEFDILTSFDDNIIFIEVSGG